MNFTLYRMNIFIFLTFFYMFIVLSTFTTISYIPIEKRVPQNAGKCTKAPPQSFVPAVGLPPLLLWLHENRPAIRVGRFSL